MGFDIWMAELRKVAVEMKYVSDEADIHDDVWRVYYESGFSPKEAIFKDLSYA